MANRKSVCIDFDGVLYSYESGWGVDGALVDGPVEGSMQFLIECVLTFNVNIYSCRSAHKYQRKRMRKWVKRNLRQSGDLDSYIYKQIKFPKSKPLASLYVDDNALRYDGGTFPGIKIMKAARSWVKKQKSVKIRNKKTK